MTEPSSELVEEIARVMADARSEHLLAYNEDQPIWKFIARAVLAFMSTPQATGLSAIAQTRDGWMPIASAPKDGRDVLCWSDGLFIGAMVLYWMDGYWREKANCQGLKRDPDYWMPLASPPIERSEDRRSSRGASRQ